MTNVYDTAGRVSSVSGTKTGEPNKTYASSISYASHGAVKAMQLGNSLWEHTNFSNRLHLTRDAAGNAFTYDLENHQKTFNGTTATYAYDGEDEGLDELDAFYCWRASLLENLAGLPWQVL